jgi:hypothetical protein
LCAFEPVLVVDQYRWWTVPTFGLCLAPLACAGVAGLGRGQWVRAAGAWLVFFGQCFALAHNATHSESWMGMYSGWAA